MAEKIQENTLQQATSTDFNDASDVLTRVFSEALKFLTGAKGVLTAESTVPLSNVPDSTVSGLDLIAQGTDLATLTPGVILQLSSTYPEVAGNRASDLKIGINASNLTVALPASGGWSLIEGRVVDVAAETASRRIFDVGTQLFVPTNVTVLTQRQFEFQIIGPDASNIPAPTGNPWVVMYAILRTASGPLTNDQVVDLRKQASEYAVPAFSNADASILDSRMNTFTDSVNPAPSEFISVDADLTSQGVRLKFRGGTLTIPPENGSTFGSNEQRHLYVCPIQIPGGAIVSPKNRGTGGFSDVTTQGVLIAGNVDRRPTQGVSTNDMPINLPAPYRNLGFPVGQMVQGTCVALTAIKRNSSNNGWLQQSAGSGGVTTCVKRIIASVSGSTPATETPDATEFVPGNARSVKWRIEVGHSGGGAADTQVLLIAGATGGENTLTIRYIMPSGAANAQMFDEVIDIPISINPSTAAPFQITVNITVIGTELTSLTGAVSVIGWTV